VRPAPETISVNDEVTIVKLRPDGNEATRYPGKALPSPPGWLVAEAVWTTKRVDLGYLIFDVGDRLIEYFAIDQPLNVFRLHGNNGELKGWYANVTHPTYVDGLTISWHDLYLDVVVYPDGSTLLLDEDELAEAMIAESNPELFRLIMDGKDRLLDLARSNSYPFSERALPAGDDSGPADG
jgi:predicted RNA-binding protein associated with RNAse of E/G family